MRRRLDALLLLDKPAGISSNGALQQARRLFGAAKAGHGGTLDPLASGVLPVLFGEATKFSRFLLDSDKEYLADVRLGASTSTGDAEGEVTARSAVDADGARIEAALARFRGEIEQIAPMYSALKREGRPLYELARRGVVIARRPRRVVIRALELLERSGDVLRLRVRCSKGTYVRALAEDLGAALGTLAHLGALRRTAAGRFTLEQAVPLQSLAAMEEAARERLLVPVEALLQDLPSVQLDPERARCFLNGRCVAHGIGPEGRCRVYGEGHGLLGVGEMSPAGELRPFRLLARAPRSSQAAEIPTRTL